MPIFSDHRHAFILLAFSLIFISQSCNKDPLANQPSAQEISAYLTGYTSGQIGPKQPVRLQFAQPMVESTDGNKEAPSDWLTFEPSTSGRTVWENTRTILFEPTDSWQPGQEYVATAHLSRAIDTLESGPKTYTFGFAVRKQTLRFVVDGLEADGDDITSQKLTGRIILGDPVKASDLQGLITATQNEQELSVSYEGEGAQYGYVVTGIQRQEEAGVLDLRWSGTKLGNEDLSGARQVNIPAISDFSVTEVIAERDPEPRVRIRFSDPIDPNQDLTGLISLSDGGSMRTRIDGNIVYAYLNDDRSAQETLRIAANIKNTAGRELGRPTEHQLSLSQPDPQIRLVGDGVVLPHQGQRIFPFEAVGLEAVRLEIFRIFDNNVIQFLQENTLEYGRGSRIRRVGRIIHRERLELSELASDADLANWTRYAIDLSDYLAEDSKSIYQVRLGFFFEDAYRNCDQTLADFGVTNGYLNTEEPLVGFADDQRSFMGSYYGPYGYIDGAEWSDRDNACHPYYYNEDRFVSRNLISSNLGLMAKRNDDKSTMVLVTDLITAKPVSGAQVKIYDTQQQVMITLKTDGEGRAIAQTTRRPAYVIVSNSGDVGYLELDTDNLLSMSKFDVSGTTARGGVKGAFYAERGVWRPGDKVYLNFVIEDRLLKLPASYPIEFILTDPRGRIREQRTVKAEVGDMYPLYFETEPDDPTGNWQAVVRAGGQTFSRTLMIETIKPNRLKIDLDFNGEALSPSNNSISLKSAYLTGASAAGLNADVSWALKSDYSGYEQYPQFVWHDPARRKSSTSTTQIFEGALGSGGMAKFQIPSVNQELPGPMRAGFKTRVYEPGGNFSVDNISTAYRPYTTLVGVRLPRNRWGGKELDRGRDNAVEFQTVNPDGSPAANRYLTVGVYSVDWRYWWQDNYDNVSRFNSIQHTQSISKGEVRTDGNGEASYTVRVEDWGRYLVRVCDPQSGHCTGDFFYAGYPDDASLDREAASILRLQTDKTEYESGDEVSLTIPGSAGGMALVSLENSVGVLQTDWVETQAGETVYKFKVDRRMVPTVYANVTMIQPYEQTINDRPIRLYGVVGIGVVEPETRLEPKIATADEYAPEETVTVKVSETGGKAMNYTLAVVDEGLLGLTRFQTPDLWERFFSKEALGVRTYDMYRYVIGNMGNSFDRVLAIGGDAEGGDDDDDERANRFEPVVRHLGPFALKAGKSNTHEVTLPNYVGAVRVMVVAEGDRAYGSAAEEVPVRKPLMLLPTLPRVIGPGETLDMPVNVFALDGKVKNAQVRLTESSNLVRIGENSRSCSFTEPGDDLVRFPLEVGDELGVARFQVLAEGNGERSTAEIEIDIRNPNSQQLEVNRHTIAPGETKVINYAPFGSKGTRSAVVEMAGIPTLNLERHLRYLLRYPYGCVEQTVSPAFAQLHLAKLVDLTSTQEKQIQNNINAALARLTRFQTSSGAMAYWPGRTRAQPWATNYALHFILEAERAGYTLPINLKENLVSFQRAAASNWQSTVYDFYTSNYQRKLDQSYRLYTLALAGEPDLGAMNRLRGLPLNTTARFRLAAAYSLSGRQSVADELFNKGGTDLDRDGRREMAYTFGSDIRDMAMLLEASLLTDNQDQANQIVVRLAKRVNESRWLSTQEAAFVILAIGKMLGETTTGNPVLATYTSAGGSATDIGNSDAAFVQVDLPTDNASSFTIKNRGQGTLFLSVVTGGIPSPGQEKAIQENLKLQVTYRDLNGSPIDVSKLRAGTDFVAVYTVTNPGTLGIYYRQMALRQAVASGWEIVNERLDAVSDGQQESSYEYKDVRDDRVHTFFSLGNGNTATYRLRLTATYPGRYYLPGAVAEAMYDGEVFAGTEGEWVVVE
ncbi:MAG: MG2 domain-containing protein [Bacteroidota bacterium]